MGKRIWHTATKEHQVRDGKDYHLERIGFLPGDLMFDCDAKTYERIRINFMRIEKLGVRLWINLPRGVVTSNWPGEESGNGSPNQGSK